MSRHTRYLYFLLLSPFCLSLYAAPSVALKTQTSQSVITAVITATEFPAVTSLSITCSYDPTLIDLPDAIIHSPISSTTIGALLRTIPDTSLLITITATSTILPGNESPLVSLEIPSLNGTTTSAIHITNATYTDTNGETHSATISTTAGYRFNTNRHIPYSTHQTTHLSAAFLLNGRQFRQNPSGNTLILQKQSNHRTAFRILTIR